MAKPVMEPFPTGTESYKGGPRQLVAPRCSSWGSFSSLLASCIGSTLLPQLLSTYNPIGPSHWSSCKPFVTILVLLALDYLHQSYNILKLISQFSTAPLPSNPYILRPTSSTNPITVYFYQSCPI